MKIADLLQSLTEGKVLYVLVCAGGGWQSNCIEALQKIKRGEDPNV